MKENMEIKPSLQNSVWGKNQNRCRKFKMIHSTMHNEFNIDYTNVLVLYVHEGMAHFIQ